MDEKPKKILAVDDDKFLLEMFAAKFKEQGFDVTTADDGQVAWDLIQGGYRPDIVFTGIIMPKMTGFDLIKKMQADPTLAKIPVAISSHRGRQEDRDMAKTLGVDDFLVQGTVPLHEVARRINFLLGVYQKYRVKVERNQYDNEAIIDVLDKQQSTEIGFRKSGPVFLEFEPKKEIGEFKVKLVADEDRPPLERGI